MPTYKTLNQKHSEYDDKLYKRLRLLRQGGYTILKQANHFIPKAPSEPSSRYAYRLLHASYMPYFSEAIGYVVSALFSHEIQVAPRAEEDEEPQYPDKDFYATFAKDADLKGSTFGMLARRVVMDALTWKHGYIVVDLPPADGSLLTREEEDIAGSARAYCDVLDIDKIINYQRDDITRKFKWCVLREVLNEQKGPLVANETYEVEFKVWTLEGEGEYTRALYECYRTGPVKNGEEPKDDTELRLDKRGLTSFLEIPILDLCMPDELWGGNLIGPLCEEHFRQRSELLGAMSEANVEIPLIRLGMEVPAQGGMLPAQVQMVETRGESAIQQYKQKGFTVLGSGDNLEFRGPSGVAFGQSNDMLNALREEIFRALHAMALSVDNTGAALGRSGESKSEDRQVVELLLNAYAQLVRPFCIGVYDVVSNARAETVEWTAHGLDEYSQGDMSPIVEEFTMVQALSIPSPTFQKEYKTSRALKLLPGASPETKAAITKELSEGIDDDLEHKDAMKVAVRADADARAAGLTNGSPQKAPGKAPGQPGNEAPPGPPA